MLSDEALIEFKQIWVEEIGTEISDEKAVELALNLLTLFDKIYRPLKKSWLEEDSKRKDDKKYN